MVVSTIDRSAEGRLGGSVRPGDGYAARLVRLLEMAEGVLAQGTLAGLLRRTAEAARELTSAHASSACYRMQRDGTFALVAGSAGLCSGQYRALLENLAGRSTLRLVAEPAGDKGCTAGAPGSPLLLARLSGHNPAVTGLLIVAGQPGDAFSEEDEMLIGQLASLASLGIQHLEAHAESEARAAELNHERVILRTVMENTQAQLAYLDTHFNFVHVNASYVRDSGYRRDQLIGRNHFSVFPNPENQAIFEHAVASGEPVVFRARPFFYPLQPERGITYWDWTLTPVKDSAGAVKGLVLSLLDVTETMRRQTLREALDTIHRHMLATLDVGEVMQQVMAEAVRALGCDSATVALRDGNEWVTRHAYGELAGLVGFRFEYDGSYLSAEALRTGDICYSADVLNDPRFPPFRHELINVRAAIALPLLARGEPFGIMFFNHHRQPILFSADQLDFARKLASSVSFAFENARLYEAEYRHRLELEERVAERTSELMRREASLRVAYQALADRESELSAEVDQRRQAEQVLALHSQRLEILHQIDLSILSADSAQEIAQAATRRIREAIPCQRASVVTYDFTLGLVHWLAVDSETPSAFNTDNQAPLANYPSLASHLAGAPRIVEDLALLSSRSPVEEAMLAEGLRCYISLPLSIGHEPPQQPGSGPHALIGALNLWRREPGVLPPEALDVARQVADSLAVAIENSHLNEQVRQGRSQLQELSRRLVEVQEDERREIARELHDEAGQGLTALSVGLGLIERDGRSIPAVAERAAELNTLTSQVMEALHSLAVNLRPASLDRLGLVPALRQHVEQFERQHDLRIDMQVSDLEDRRLSPEVETALYRILQESLTNVARHADARNVGIVLTLHAGRVTAIVEDDGCGFDPTDALLGGRMGLVGMRERAEMLGGTLTIESSPGAGTTLYVDVPCGCEAGED